MMKFIKKIINKLIIQPIKYKKSNDYHSERYWHDRFKKYNNSLGGVGNEGLTEKENEELYNQSKILIKEITQNYLFNLKDAKFLEIGPGLGIFTDLFYNELKISDLTAMDITDYYFPTLKRSYPNYRFVKKDISQEAIPENYNVIFMIDVIEHIVNITKFNYTLNNIIKSLKPGGYFVITGHQTHKKSRKRLFYVKTWNKSDILQRLNDFTLIEEHPFRKTNLMLLQKPQETE